MPEYELTLMKDGRVYVETSYLLELTDSDEFKELTGREFSALVRLAITVLEELVKKYHETA